VLGVEDWAEIRRLCRAEQMPIKAVARVMGVSKNTVKRALAADGPPRYERMPRGSVVDGVEPRIRELLQAWPTMPATVIAERIGWTRGVTVLRDRVAEPRSADGRSQVTCSWSVDWLPWVGVRELPVCPALPRWSFRAPGAGLGGQAAAAPGGARVAVNSWS
jgi:hypothetical protein